MAVRLGATVSIDRHGRHSVITPVESPTRIWNDSSTDSSVGGAICANCGFISVCRRWKSTPTSSDHEVDSSASRRLMIVRDSDSSMSVSSRSRPAPWPVPPSRRSIIEKISGRSSARIAFVPSGSSSRMLVNAGTGSDEMNSPYVTCSAPSTEMSATARSAPDRYVAPRRAKVSCSISSVRSWSLLNFDGRRKSMFWIRTPLGTFAVAICGSLATAASSASISAWERVSLPCAIGAVSLSSVIALHARTIGARRRSL